MRSAVGILRLQVWGRISKHRVEALVAGPGFSQFLGRFREVWMSDQAQGGAPVVVSKCGIERKDVAATLVAGQEPNCRAVQCQA